MRINFLHTVTARDWLPWLFFLLVFLFYTYPMGLSDFWWHMNTGRWIWDNQAIPSVDPFTYTYAKDDDIRRVVITRAYYLGQLAYYFLYSFFGIWGLLLFKAASLTLPLWLLWRCLLAKSVEWRAALMLIAPLPFLLFRFDELRPHIFSFIAAILLYWQLEAAVTRLRRGQYPGALLWWMPLTMLLWSNLHRGFIIGWVLLLVYGFAEAWQSVRHKSGYSQRALPAFLLMLAVSFLISLLNPNGANAVLANFVELEGPFMSVIDEYFPLYKYAKIYHAGLIFYGAVALVLGLSAVVIRYRREMRWPQTLLFLGFAYEGFATFRFSYFQALMLPALAAPCLAPLSRVLAHRHHKLLWGGVALSILALAYGVGIRSALWYGPLETAYFPEQAASFIQQHRPPGRMFNAFEYGGYLGWHLYPDYPVFIDQRNLDFSVYQEYSAAWQGRYQAVFDKYGINSVVFYGRQPVLLRPPPLVRSLLDDASWVPVFADSKAVVFVRRQAAAGMPEVDRDLLRRYLLR